MRMDCNYDIVFTHFFIFKDKRFIHFLADNLFLIKMHTVSYELLFRNVANNSFINILYQIIISSLINRLQNDKMMS